jgi:hypothetical protein
MTPDIPVDRLGPYPILQLAAAILVLGGLAFAVWRASRDRRTGAMMVIPDEQRMFFDGPLATTINLLRDIRNHQERLVNLNEEVIEVVRHQTGVLHEINNELKFISRTKKFGE